MKNISIEKALMFGALIVFWVMVVFGLILSSGCATKPVIETKKIIIKPPCPVSLTAPVIKERPPFPNGAFLNEIAISHIYGVVDPAFADMSQRLTQGQEWCKNAR